MRRARSVCDKESDKNSVISIFKSASDRGSLRHDISRVVLLSVLGSVPACGDGAVGALPDGACAVRVDCDATIVELGRPFPVSVVRVWPADHAPEPWDDAALRPLVLRPVSTADRRDGDRVAELRKFDAFAFGLEDVTVASPAFTATSRAGAEVRAVAPAGISVRVQRALDPAAPGEPELPGGPFPPPVAWRTWAGVAALGAAAAAAGLVLRRRARRRDDAGPAVAAREPIAPPPGPHERALERLAALREQAPRTREESEAWHSEVSDVLRDYVAERFGVRAAEATTDEILGALRSGPAAPTADAARDVLRAADLVKFARDEPAAAERDRTLALAARFVRETAP